MTMRAARPAKVGSQQDQHGRDASEEKRLPTEEKLMIAAPPGPNQIASERDVERIAVEHRIAIEAGAVEKTGSDDGDALAPLRSRAEELQSIDAHRRHERQKQRDQQSFE